MDHVSGLHPRTQEIFHTIRIVNKHTAQAGQCATAFWPLIQTEGSDVRDGVNGAARLEVKRTSVGVEVTNAMPYPRACVNY